MRKREIIIHSGCLMQDFWVNHSDELYSGLNSHCDFVAVFPFKLISMYLQHTVCQILFLFSHSPNISYLTKVLSLNTKPKNAAKFFFTFNQTGHLNFYLRTISLVKGSRYYQDLGLKVFLACTIFQIIHHTNSLYSIQVETKNFLMRTL